MTLFWRFFDLHNVHTLPYEHDIERVSDLEVCEA